MWKKQGYGLYLILSFRGGCSTSRSARACPSVQAGNFVKFNWPAKGFRSNLKLAAFKQPLSLDKNSARFFAALRMTIKHGE
jgi:hypothetical protein